MELAEVAARLAELLEWPAERVLAGVHQARAGGYETWQVPKGNGRQRTISSPREELKDLQRRILHRLLYQVPVSPYAHGFVPGRSIVTNARFHAATARSVVSVDLEDAYPSVDQERVRRTLEWMVGPVIAARFPPRVHRRPPDRDRAQRVPKRSAPLHPDTAREVSALLAEVCCYRGSLPQGAPTSGALLNLVCAGLDRFCLRLVRRHREQLPELRYTRYADDLTFTSAADAFPAEFSEAVARAVWRSGFKVNRRKLHRTDARRADLVICGVRIHEGELTLSRRTLRSYRALFHNALRHDPANVPDEVRAKVHGSLGFLTMVTAACPPILEGSLTRLLERHGSWVRPPRRSEARSFSVY